MGDPVALFKTPRVERTAPTAPAIAAATEKSTATAIGKTIWQAKIFSAIEIPRLFSRIESAAFQQACIDTPLFHFARERYSGYTAANNTHRSLDYGAFIDSSCINKHYCSPTNSSNACKF